MTAPHVADDGNPPAVPGVETTVTRGTRFALRGVGVIVAVLSSACGADNATDVATATSEPESYTVGCEFSFRRSLETARFESARLTVRDDQDEQERNLGRFRVRLLYFDDDFEGRSLNVYVYSRRTNKLLSQDLYQFGDTATNQFVGGQGFSGLRYLRDPGSRGEMQYFCEVD